MEKQPLRLHSERIMYMKASNRKITTVLLLLATATIASVIVFLFNYRIPLELFPSNETFFEFRAQTAVSPSADKSWAKFDSANGRLNFRYLIRSENSNAQLYFHSQNLARTLDISKFEHLRIETASKGNEDFTVILYLYLPGYSNPADVSTHRPYAFKCRADSVHQIFMLPIDEFATPVEWFTKNGVTEESIPKTDWSQMSHLAFMDYSGKPQEEPRQLSMKLIEFQPSKMKEAQNAGVAFLIVIAIAVVLSFLKPLVSLRAVNQTKVIKKSEPDYSQPLISYIHENCYNMEMGLDLIEREMKLNQYQVNLALKSSFEVGYKQYINSLRMNKAKQLLAETVLPIATIAEQVGYSYPNSFARTFRNSEGVTPNEFRKMSDHV